MLEKQTSIDCLATTENDELLNYLFPTCNNLYLPLSMQ